MASSGYVGWDKYCEVQMKKPLMKVPKSVSYAKAIRKKCLECTCNQSKEVELCEMVDCPLFPYRFGCGPDTVVNKYPGKFKIVKQEEIMISLKEAYRLENTYKTPP